jgi:NAD(P)-dependent dehydrogenase (short-subunit alcohol dehydrogenase family)
MTTRYHAVHEFSSLAGPGDARPTAISVINDNNLEGALTHKVILITGTSSGIGIPTVAALKATGAKIYATARDLEKGRKALGNLLDDGQVELLQLNTGDLGSVRRCAESFLVKEAKLDVLIENAGVMAVQQRQLTVDGVEEQFAVNYLGHFLLFLLLRPALLKAAEEGKDGARVVGVSSSGHRQGSVNLEDLNWKSEGSYNPWLAYGAAKTAVILMCNEIERRYGATGLHGISLNPGGIATGLQDHVKEMAEEWYKNPEAVRGMKSHEQGAATTMVAAIDKDVEGRGGFYLNDCEVQEITESKDLGGGGVAAYAMDEDLAKKLWAKAVQMVGFEDD